MRHVAVILLSSTAFGACGTDEPLRDPEPIVCESSVRIEFVADAPPVPGEEAYVCFGFDAGLLAGRPISAIRWFPPVGGGVTLHHASLYATREEPADGPMACDAMPADAVGLHVFAPGGTPLALPQGVGLELPPGTRRLFVEAHALRTASSDAAPASAEICTLTEPARLAAWIGVSAPVPAIRPRHEEQSVGRCRLPAPFRLMSSWPHLHRVGKAFHGSLLRQNGSRVRLVDVESWDSEGQRSYRLDVQAEAGDVIESRCIWQNPGDEYVLPGILTTNEMCNQGVIGWPAEAARCGLE